MNMHFDEFGLIVNYRDKDGGDSCCFSNHMAFALPYQRPNAKYLIDQFYKGFGIFCRHPAQKMWKGWLVMSRDQAAIVVRQMRFHDRKKLLIFAFFLFLRFNFMTNFKRNGSDWSNHSEQYKFNDTVKPLSLWSKIVLKMRIPFLPTQYGYRNASIKIPDFAGFKIWSDIFRGLNLTWLCYVTDIQILLTSRWLNKNKKHELINHYFYLIEPRPTFWIYMAINVTDFDEMKKRLADFWNAKQRPHFLSETCSELVEECFQNG